MKIFHFSPIGYYGQHYYVLSKNEDEAKKSLSDYIISQKDKDDILFWRCLIKNKLPKNYELKSYEEGVVTRTEAA